MRGETTNRTDVEVVEAVFAASQREDNRIGRSLFNEIGVVVTARTSAVATADEEEVLNGTGFYSVDDFICYRENRAVTETSHDFMTAIDTGEVLIFGITTEFESFFDDWCEILVFADVNDAREGNCFSRKDIGFIGWTRRHEAVRRKEERTGDAVEFFLLVLPSCTKVAF